MNENYELYHFGIKGQKWGIRRYQNKDGSLTPAGKKRVSKQYKKLIDKTNSRISKKESKTYVDAYNKAANHMNNGGIKKYNAEQQKKYGDKYAERDGYISDYEQMFFELVEKNYNKTVKDLITSDKDYVKAMKLVEKYNMTSWSDMAKKDYELLNSIED